MLLLRVSDIKSLLPKQGAGGTPLTDYRFGLALNLT